MMTLTMKIRVRVCVHVTTCNTAYYDFYFIIKHAHKPHTYTHSFTHTHILAFVARLIFYCVGKLHFCVNIYFVDNIIQYIHRLSNNSR